MNRSKKILSLKDKRVFTKLYKRGVCISGRCLVMYYRENKENVTHLGITVSKKLGKAVIRNTVKRRIREAFRQMLPYVKDGYDIVVVARKSCTEVHFTVIQNELHGLLKEAALSEAE